MAFGLVNLKTEGSRIETGLATPDLRKFGPGITVGDFIKALKQFPAHQRVMVRSYESGFDNPEPLEVITVKPDAYDSSVYGDYESAKDGEPDAIKVILIDRP